jgi:hypothetical protein
MIYEKKKSVNPANHWESGILLNVNMGRITELVLGKASFKLSERPLLWTALI